MSINLTSAVMTHARRRKHAERLAELCSDLAPTVVEDPGAGSTLVTSALAWATAGGASHHLVLQDDITPSEGLAKHATELAAREPGAAISLFTEWGCRTASRVRVAALAGESTAPVVDPYVPSQALILPTAVALAFAEHAASLDPTTPDDVALREFLNTHGVRQLVSVPNLVQHDLEGTASPSLTGNAFQGLRRSVCFVPPSPESALSAGRGTSPSLAGGAFQGAHEPGSFGPSPRCAGSSPSESALPMGGAESSNLSGSSCLGAHEPGDFGLSTQGVEGLPSESALRLAHMGWMRATAEVFDDSPEAPPAFVGTPVAQTLPEQVSPGQLAERFARTLEHVTRTRGPELTHLLDRTVLFELWVCWYANGLGSGLRAEHLEHERLGPVAEAALGTVLPGVFRRYVPVATLETVREHAVEFVLDALRYGVAEPTEVRDRWRAG